jgi:hypothetical protein
MPEILLLLTFVGFVAYRIAAEAEKRRIKSPAEIQNEVQRLALRHAWLCERIERALAESWGDMDVRRLRAQLGEVERAQSELATGPAPRIEQR